MKPTDPVAAMRAALREYAVHVHDMSWHGEMMVCDLCGSEWNNGMKRGEPATPETHKPDCLLVLPLPPADAHDEGAKVRDGFYYGIRDGNGGSVWYADHGDGMFVKDHPEPHAEAARLNVVKYATPSRPADDAVPRASDASRVECAGCDAPATCRDADDEPLCAVCARAAMPAADAGSKVREALATSRPWRSRTTATRTAPRCCTRCSSRSPPRSTMPKPSSTPSAAGAGMTGRVAPTELECRTATTPAPPPAPSRGTKRRETGSEYGPALLCDCILFRCGAGCLHRRHYHALREGRQEVTWRDITWYVVSMAVFINAGIQIHRLGKDWQ